MRRSLFWWLITVLFFPIGICYYFLSGVTLSYAHQSMIFLFCFTRGGSNEFFSKIISLFKFKTEIEKDVVNFPVKININIEDAVTNLNKYGYYVEERALPLPVVEKLLDFAKHQTSTRRVMDDQDESKMTDEKYSIYGGDEIPEAVRYDYKLIDLIKCEWIQDIVSSEIILNIAQQYLNTTPKLDILNMWWHTNYSDTADSKAAQYFHFDMDRIKWLKVFIYVTDVGYDNGPHTFISGSHAPNGIPRKFLKKGYVRLSDEEVINYYGENASKCFIAPKGTIIFEDTRGLHKGNHVKDKSRLILQLQYSNSLFGAANEKVICSDIKSENLKIRIQKTPEIYNQYYMQR